MDDRRDIFITLTTDTSDLSVAEDLRKALNCEKHAFFQDIMTGRESIPITQTRMSFHGHGDIDIFGSRNLHFTPSQFAGEIIKILEANKQITDIDLLSCNVGMIDSSGYSYAGKLQDLLQQAGYAIHVNTFVVLNSKNDVFSSFFVVGLNEGDTKMHLNKPILKPDEFALDIIRTSHQEQMDLYQKLTAAFARKEECNRKIDILDVIYKLISNEDGNHVTLTEFTQGIQAKGYLDTQIADLIAKYHIEFINDGHIEPHVKTTLLSPMERAGFTGYCENVANGICMYKKDVSRTEDCVSSELYHINKKITELSEEFAIARAKEGRVYKDKLQNIRNYLRPIKELAAKKVKLAEELDSRDVHKDEGSSPLVMNSLFHQTPTFPQSEKEDKKDKPVKQGHKSEV